MLTRWAVPVVMVLGLGVAANASAQGTNFRVLAGSSPAGSADGTGGAARFNVPTGIAVNSAGTVYVTDSWNFSIRAVTPAGAVTVFAGSGAFGSADGTGSAAQFSVPQGAAVDSTGNVYIADTFSHTIRTITPAGVVTTLAGLAGSLGTADGTGTAARFSRPIGIAVDSAGNVYVSDSNNHTIRKIAPGGVVTTLAGLAGTFGSVDGTGTAARFNQPRGIAVDGAGVLYVADSANHVIRKIAAGGVVTTLAGLAGTSGNTEGTGSAARFFSPRGLAINSAGTSLFVADTNNNRIREVTTAGGVVTTLAGSNQFGGFDGTGTSARFNAPEGVAVDGAGVVYVADTVSDTIRKITGGVVTTLAGFYGSFDAVDGTGAMARFAYPYGVALDTSGNIYVPDRSNYTLRKVTPAGNVTTLAGLANTPGSADGTGSAARFNAVQGVAVDGAGTVYVSDTASNTIRTVTPGGSVLTLAGLAGPSGSTDGTGSAARFNQPRGLAVDSTGNVYVADGNNHTIRKIAPGGTVTTLAGLAGSSGSTNGTGTAARFNGPRGVAIDATGLLYVTDSNNHTIRQITAGGVVTTLAGLPGSFGFVDGTGSTARFGNPQAIAVDGTGTLYVADTGNSTIRKVTPAGVVTTIAGCPGCLGSANSDRFNMPQGIAVNARGDLYVADSRNNTIQTSAPMPSSLVVDFGPGYGLWIRRGASNWSQLHPYSADGFLTISDGDKDALIVDFGPGVGLWFWLKEEDGDELWFQLHTASPTAMVGMDFDRDGEVEAGVFTFPGQGVWLYDGDIEQWSQLHPYDASYLAASDVDNNGAEDVIVAFPGYGVWVWYGGSTWAQLHPVDVSALITADLDGNGSQDLLMDFPGYGVWSYRIGVGWAQVHPRDATHLAAGDLDGNGASDLMFDFGAGVGVWVLQNGTTWWPLHPLTTDGITTGDVDGNGHDEVIIDFGAPGVWSFEDLGGWQQVHGLNPKAIAMGRLF